jgi:hypothetical protein
VESDPKLDPERPGGDDDVLGAADGPGRTVEGGHEAVAGGVDFLAPGSPQLVSHRLVVGIEQRPPAAITERGGTAGRIDDVGKQDGGEKTLGLGRAFPGQEFGDLVGDPGAVLCEGVVVRARKLDESRAVDVLSEVAAEGARNDVVLSGMQHQGRHMDQGQRLTNIDMAQDVVELGCRHARCR